ncbi:uncharacterized protein RCC_07182 [Ramularia collo-cygni]|uniref:Uncharacterized protein n=1 Tax=Ramularia collo-cygni TaxID=112498 RepID=A0A2D3V0L7_9PEZI|nr:uncharacterized protein RCC_07182 [Ramularia collo-cygni]CZT21318.1 uncharacterized protein RCC_07182 [Ramularia collo-cygni]
MKFLSVGLLFFVAGALASDYLLTYSCYNKTGGINKNGNNESKLAGKVSEDFADKIEDKMEDWSDGKYEAKKKSIGRNTITIVCKNGGVDTKQQALDAVSDQQRIVNSHKDD